MDYISKVKRKPRKELIDKIKKFQTATIHEAYGKRGALPSIIKPLDDNFSLAGPAVTVELRPGDNLMLHRAIYEANKEDVLIVDAKGFSEAGVWGEIMTNAAIERGIAGLVIYGSVRDKKEIIKLGFPVFSSGVCIKGTTKVTPGFINKQICISNVIIEPGDVIRGNSDGVVVVRYGDLEEVILKAEKIIEKEDKVLKKIKNGLSTLEIYNFKDLSKYDFKKNK